MPSCFALFIHQAIIAMQEIHEQEGTTTLVAIRERMILDDKIQEVRRLTLDGWVGRFAKDALVQIAKDAFQSITARPGEEIGSLTTCHQLLLELTKCLHGHINRWQRSTGMAFRVIE